MSNSINEQIEYANKLFAEKLSKGKQADDYDIAFLKLFGDMNSIVRSKAKDKGYGELFRILSLEHHLDEIICKAVRYKAKRNKEDIAKIAAWCWLIYIKLLEDDDNAKKWWKEQAEYPAGESTYYYSDRP